MSDHFFCYVMVMRSVTLYHRFLHTLDIWHHFISKSYNNVIMNLYSYIVFNFIYFIQYKTFDSHLDYFQQIETKIKKKSYILWIWNRIWGRLTGWILRNEEGIIVLFVLKNRRRELKIKFMKIYKWFDEYDRLK